MAGRITPTRFLRAVGLVLAAVLNLALRTTRRHVGLAVAYHEIGDRQGDPRRELVPPRDSASFREELRYLRRHYRLVTATDFRAAIATRRRWGRFPICVTLDDDLAEHAQTALTILNEESTPATFFLCGASLDQAYSFWWERLQRAVDAEHPISRISELLPLAAVSGLPDRFDIHAVAAEVQRLPRQERDAVAEELLALAGPDPESSGLRAQGIDALVQSGHTLGFHTRRHEDLTRLNDEQLAVALTAGREQLESLAGRKIHVIAYPHGAADARVAGAARDADFTLGFTTSRCTTSTLCDPLLVGRIVADGISSLAEFALRISITLLAGPDCPLAETAPVRAH